MKFVVKFFRNKMLLCILPVVGLYLALAAYPLVRHQGKASWFHKLGTRFALEPEKIPTNAHLFQGLGYDGQFYFYMALDPFLKGKPCECIDSPPYRYGRIGFPLIAGLLSGWNKNVLPWSFLMLNILCIVGLVYLIYKMLEDLGINPSYSAVFCLAPGLTISFTWSTLELPAIFFMAGGLYALEKRKTVLGTCLLGYAPLIRETCLMANIVGVIFGKTYTGKKVNRLVFVPGFLVYGLWQGFLMTKVGTSLKNTSNFGPFFEGIFDVIYISWPIGNKIIPIFLVLSLTLCLPLYVASIIKKRNMALLASLVWIVLITKYPVAFWSQPPNYFRAFVDFSFWSLLASQWGIQSRAAKIFLIINACISLPILAIISR